MGWGVQSGPSKACEQTIVWQKWGELVAPQTGDSLPQTSHGGGGRLQLLFPPPVLKQACPRPTEEVLLQLRLPIPPAPLLAEAAHSALSKQGGAPLLHSLC